MGTSPQPDVGERRADRDAGRSRRSVYLAVGTFYVAAALLNGRFLHQGARERKFGPVRDAWVAATRPLSEISTRLGLDRVRSSVETLREE